MKTTLRNFFKSKKNKIIVCSILILTILVSAGIYANSQKQEQARIEKLKAEEEKKKQEEREKIELAKAEEAKKKAEELEKEKQKQAEEEKAKVEQQKSEVDKREKDNFKENKTNSVKKETQKNNSTSKKTENSKKNKKKDNNNNNNNGNKFEVEEDENTYSKIGNTGKFFSTRAEATAWAKSQVANEDSIYWKNGYKSWWVGQCKHNGKIGWTVSFIK